MAHPRRTEPDDPALERVRSLALALPGAIETETFGRPWFRAGRVFAVYSGGTRGPDTVPHPHALLVPIDADELPARMQDPRFFVPAYFGPRGWLGLDIDGPDVDWNEVAELLDAAHRGLAPARFMRGLGARPPSFGG